MHEYQCASKTDAPHRQLSRMPRNKRERERERTAAARTKVVRIARAPVRRALRTMLERLVAVADAVDRIRSGQRGIGQRGETVRMGDSLVEPVDLLRLQEQRRSDRMDRSICEDRFSGQPSERHRHRPLSQGQKRPTHLPTARRRSLRTDRGGQSTASTARSGKSPCRRSQSWTYA